MTELNKPNLKYIYNGVSLRSWCADNNVSYSKVCYVINSLRRTFNKEISVEDAVKRVLKRRG